MYLNDATQQKYPKFTDYIKIDFAKLIHNRPIVYGLKKWGKMSDSDVRRYLSWGASPAINVTDYHPSPTTPISQFPSEIKLHVEMVEDFEGRDKLSRSAVTLKNGVVIPPQYPVFHNSLGQNVYIAGVEILHLLVRGYLMKFSATLYNRRSWWTWEQGFDKDVYGGELT
jgi:hypothetical protein